MSNRKSSSVQTKKEGVVCFGEVLLALSTRMLSDLSRRTNWM